MKIFISAGHNIKDTGTSWGTLKENELTIKVRDELFNLLKGDYFFPPDNLTLAETIKWINEKATPQDFSLEIHFNANNDTKLRGVEAYYYDTNRYAEVFAKEVANSLDIPNRGAKPDYMSYVGELGFLRKLKCPSVIIECLYLTNESDRIALDIKKIAQGIKNGLDILFSKPIKSDTEKIEELKIVQLNLLQRVLSALQAQLQRLLSNKLGGKNMASQLFKLNTNDFVKGAVSAVVAGVIWYLAGLPKEGFDIFTIDWGAVLNAAAAGFVGYLGKNFLSDSNGRVLGSIG